MQELEQILEEAEKLGWSLSVEQEPAGTKEGWYQEERNWVRLWKLSPAGEDFSMAIDFTKERAKETFLENLNEYLDSFDVDEHVEQWISQRGKGGCPDSILELIADAEQIRSSIFELWESVAGEQTFGTLRFQLSTLLQKVQNLLTLAPSKEECSEEENQVFSDLANLKESLTSAGI